MDDDRKNQEQQKGELNMSILKNKTTSQKLVLVCVVLTAIITCMYTVFGIVSKTTVPVIILCLAVDLLLGVLLLFYKGTWKDYAFVGMGALLGVAFATLGGNSIGDITEFITGVGMYGDPGNVYIRGIMALLLVADLVLTILAGRKD